MRRKPNENVRISWLLSCLLWSKLRSKLLLGDGLNLSISCFSTHSRTLAASSEAICRSVESLGIIIVWRYPLAMLIPKCPQNQPELHITMAKCIQIFFANLLSVPQLLQAAQTPLCHNPQESTTRLVNPKIALEAKRQKGVPFRGKNVLSTL